MFLRIFPTSIRTRKRGFVLYLIPYRKKSPQFCAAYWPWRINLGRFAFQFSWRGPNLNWPQFEIWYYPIGRKK